MVYKTAEQLNRQKMNEQEKASFEEFLENSEALELRRCRVADYFRGG